MSPPLRDSLLRFWQPTAGGLAVAGTGFLAAGADGNCYALTCAHVANLALGRSKGSTEALTSGSVTADLGSRRDGVMLDLVAWFAPPPIDRARVDAVADIAVFKPRQPLRVPFMPKLRDEPPRRVLPRGDPVEFESFGFMGTPDGTSAHGALTAVDMGEWFVADGIDGFRRFIEEGLSGAPVHANGKILGMVTQRLEREAKQGLVIPAFWLAKAWPPLAQPYPGLFAFDAATAHLYFGRGKPAQAGGPPTGRLAEIVDRLDKQRLVGLMGASGSGKSSLARAGVAPIYEERGWTTIVFRPGLEPLDNLARAIAEAVGGAAPIPERIGAAERWAAWLKAGKLAMALDAVREPGAEGTLVVVDQFEEFFTATGNREAKIAQQRRLILPQLLAAADRPDVRCLLTARLDLIERMITGDPVAARMLSDPYPFIMLTKMSAGEVRAAIEEPARLFGVKVDPGFAADLATEATRGEGRLPLLQAALRQAWGRIEIEKTNKEWRLERPGDTVPNDPAGILDAALGERADTAVVSLRRGRNDRPGIADDDLRRVLLRLVRLADGTPIRSLVARKEVNAEDWAILEALAAERLVMLDGERGTAELVHEALMTRWPQLKRWIDDDAIFLAWRDRFDRDFAVWLDRGRNEEDLLRRQDVATALDWQEKPQPNRARPTSEQRDYIGRSHKFYEADSERQRRRLIGTGIALIVASFAFVFAGGAYFTASERGRLLTATLVARDKALRAAENASAEAEKQAREAVIATNAALLQESRAIASLAQQESSRGDQPTAMLLALEALPTPAFGGDRPPSPEAATALRQAWLRNRELTLAGHTGPVRAVSISADGRQVVTGSNDGTARLWNLSWDPSGPRPTAATVPVGFAKAVLATSFSRGKPQVVSASDDDSTALVWDLSRPEKPAITARLDGYKGPVLAAAISANGQRVVTASNDGTVRVWDLSTPQPPAKVLEGHTGPVRAAAISDDGQRVVMALNDGAVRVWTLSDQGPIAPALPEGQTVLARTASISDDGKRIMIGTKDGSVRVWNLPGPQPVGPKVLEGHTGLVHAASISANGELMVTVSDDDTARVWNLSGTAPVPVAVLIGHAGPVHAVSVSADGRRAVTGSDDGTARVWDLSRPQLAIAVLAGQAGQVRAASIGGGDQRVVTLSNDGITRGWALPGWQPINPNPPHEGAGPVRAASFNADGNQMMTVSADGAIRKWDRSRQPPVAIPLPLGEGQKERLLAASLSADGLHMVTVAETGAARIWDLSGQQPVPTPLPWREGHAGLVLTAAISDDGKRVVTGSKDRTARIWNLSWGPFGPHPVPGAVLAGHAGLVLAAAISADGRRVVTGADDGTARVWDVSGPHPVTTAVLEGHEGAVIAVSISNLGQQIVTASDSAVRVWTVHPDITELSKLVVTQLSRCLSNTQRELYGLDVRVSPIRPATQSRTIIPMPDVSGNCPR